MRFDRSRMLAEGIGTFCLVFAGTGAVITERLSGGKLGQVGVGAVFGLIVLAMIYSVGHVSGAHLNPAVTLGFWSAGRHGGDELVPYISAQLIGAALASAALSLIFRGQPADLGMTQPVGPAAQSFALELAMSFILMFTIMGVATDDRAEGGMAGIAIGGVVALEAIFGGPISGASMNPARSFAPALLCGDFANQWLYWAAPILGAFLGAGAYRLIRS